MSFHLDVTLTTTFEILLHRFHMRASRVFNRVNKTKSTDRTKRILPLGKEQTQTIVGPGKSPTATFSTACRLSTAFEDRRLNG